MLEWEQIMSMTFNRISNILCSTAGGYALLLVAVLAVSYASMGMLIWSWDDGNLLYDSWRVLHGGVPNHDFVSGYPGGHAVLIALFMKLFGETVSSAHIYVMLSAIVISSLVYFLSLHFAGPAISLLLGYAAAWHSALIWWTPMPGMAGQIGHLCMIAVAFRIIRREEMKLRFFFILGLILGVTFTFRQAAVFSGVGLVYFFWWLFVVRYPERSGPMFKVFVVTASCSLPILFAFLRINGQYPTQNYGALLPWFLVLFYLLVQTVIALRKDLKTKAAQDHFPVKAFAVSIAGCLAGLAPLIIWYLWNGADLSAVFKEIFVRMPVLIDRDILPAGISTREIAVFMTIFSILFYVWLRPDRQKSTQGIIEFILIILIVFSGILIVNVELSKPLIYPKKLFFYLFRFDFMSRAFWGAIVVTVLGITAIFLNTRPKKIFDQRTSLLTIILLFSGPYFANMFPYPASLYSIGVELLTGVAFVSSLSVYHHERTHAIQKEKHIKVVTFASRPLIFGVVVAVVLTFSLDRIRTINSYEKIDTPIWRGRIASNDLSGFIELAQYLAQLPKDFTVATYPNMALSLFLTKEITPIQYGNFLGNFQEDLSDMIKEIDDKFVDIVVVNKMLIPYNGKHPYFVDPGYFVSLLPGRYQMVDRIGSFEIYKQHHLAIHR